MKRKIKNFVIFGFMILFILGIVFIMNYNIDQSVELNFVSHN